MKGSRPGAALVLCGSILVAPLLLVRSSTASATSVGHRRHGGDLASALPGAGTKDQSWQLSAAAYASIDNPSAYAVAEGVDASTGAVATTTTTAPTPVAHAVPVATPPVTAPPVTAPPTTAPPVTTPPVAASPPRPAPPSHSMVGVATYYGAAAGTCASPFLPFGTVVTVTNPANGRSVQCTVDDREADTQRAIDLATATFAALAPLSQGVIANAQLSW